MKDTKRALRRHHRQRMIARTMRSSICRWIEPEEDRYPWILRYYNNRAKCSCHMCGHRRKWWGPTMQERRSLHKDAEEFVWLYQREAIARLQKCCEYR